MAPKPSVDAVARIDPAELAAFRSALRRRFSDEQILVELRAHAARTGRSPTMKEFAADVQAAVHPQTVIEHFGSWNAAKRAAGLVPRRFATREELARACARSEPSSAARRTRATSTSAAGRCLRSRSTMSPGSFHDGAARAGFDVAAGQERLERAVVQGAELARSLGRLPKFADWALARRARTELLTEWQVYRMFETRRAPGRRSSS